MDIVSLGKPAAAACGKHNKKYCYFPSCGWETLVWGKTLLEFMDSLTDCTVWKSALLCSALCWLGVWPELWNCTTNANIFFCKLFRRIVYWKCFAVEFESEFNRLNDRKRNWLKLKSTRLHNVYDAGWNGWIGYDYYNHEGT